MNTVQPPVEHGQSVLDDGINVRRSRLRRRKAGQSRKFIDQSSQCFHRPANGFRTTVQNLQGSRVGRRAAIQMAANALRREGDGCQWVFDFVRYPARHFTPGGLLLRLQQVGQVLEYQNIAQPFSFMLKRRHRHGRVKWRRMQRYFQLCGGRTHAVRASQQRLQIFQNLLREYVAQSGADSHIRRRMSLRRMD